ncbi:hypothetical protein K523DRAFT_50046 [Schizophyllum commune Tattone D]|nr:hypothetical protein K523DRAFT_50046 [Schizophyllum commune Tattone D]
MPAPCALHRYLSREARTANGYPRSRFTATRVSFLPLGSFFPIFVALYSPRRGRNPRRDPPSPGLTGRRGNSASARPRPGSRHPCRQQQSCRRSCRELEGGVGKSVYFLGNQKREWGNKTGHGTQVGLRFTASRRTSPSCAH